MMNKLCFLLLIISCQTRPEETVTQKEYERIDKQLEYEERLIKAGYSEPEVDSLIKKMKW